MKKQVLTLKELLKVALLSYEQTLILFNKDYTFLTIKDLEFIDDYSIYKNNFLIIDKNELSKKEIISIVKEYYLNNIENNKKSFIKI